MYERKVYQFLANAAWVFGKDNEKYREYWEDKVDEVMDKYAPSGSGFDRGTEFLVDSSDERRLVFVTSFHHMNEGGFYTDWTEHTVAVTPSLMLDFDIRVSGGDEDIKSYIVDVFVEFLRTEVKR